MSLTQEQVEKYRGYRGDRRCKRCSWFGHMAYNCQYEERLVAREQRRGLCNNRWNVLKSRVMGCKENRKVVHSEKREAQQGVRCWGYEELGQTAKEGVANKGKRDSSKEVFGGKTREEMD